MKITLPISDEIFRELERRAPGNSLDLVEETLRRGLDDSRASGAAFPPPPFHQLGVPSVDVADRDALWRAMERR